ncbi:MAG TPA: methyltransferase domain-containing protein [Rhodocyclaceae bacterium]|nr:methyltransferase domain-containing protein [Rhodocyclaceae bacterium]
MSIPVDFEIDRRLVRRRFEQAASHADETGFLAREVAQRMAQRLSYIKLQPERILDIGCGVGRDFPLLVEYYPHAECIGVDFALSTLRLAHRGRGFFQKLIGGARKSNPRYVAADAETLPLARASVQMVWSNLMLNWLHDPMPALREMHRVLAIDGMVMFATLGPDTLKELRTAMPMTYGERVHRFIDMHDLGDCLLQAGFAEPVMDMDTVVLTYDDLDGLIRDLRMAGATNASTARPRGLTAQSDWIRAREAYEKFRVDGRLPATFEIVYGHAWKAAPKKLEDGRSVIQFRHRS